MTQERSAARAVVTGASAGIGTAFAERLARDGYDVVLVARRRERLDALAARLRAETGREVEVAPADLTSEEDLAALEQRISADDRLRLLVNNAGFGGYMPFAQLPPERAEELIRLQVLAPTRLTRAALPGMTARGHGAIINVASLLAFSAPLPAPPLPFRATYAATKAYLTTFTQILAQELTGTEVQVQVLCPGTVPTEFHRLMGLDVTRMPITPMSADEGVQASLAGLRLGEVVCVPGLDDPAALEALRTAQVGVFDHSRANVLADRYTTTRAG
jgi:short-subunit dehydrogenase